MGQSCTALGHLRSAGRFAERDYGLAAALYRWGCAKGDDNGCVELGRLYELGRGMSPDHPGAVGLYELSCRRGSAAGCFHLALMYSAGRGAPREEELGQQLLRTSCERDDGVGSACLRLASQATDPREKARRLKQTLSKAIRACRADGGFGEDCEVAGAIYEAGIGVTREIGRATRLFQRACLLGRRTGCEREDPDLARGIKLLDEARDEEALDAFQRALSHNESPARAHLYLGITYFNLLKRKSAMHHVRQAFQLEPDVEILSPLAPKLRAFIDALKPKVTRSRQTA